MYCHSLLTFAHFDTVLVRAGVRILISYGLDDSFVFYIDGVEQVQTSGDPVRVQRELDDGEGSHLLMWVFKRDVGDARIRNL